MIYKTSAVLIRKASAIPPTNGEYVNPAGFYMASDRHAYVDGTMTTLCGLPLTRMMAFWSELDWRDGGSHPARCQDCTAEAV